MARRLITTIKVTDDFDQTELAENEAVSVEFIFEGTKYVVDTNGERAEEFRAFLAPWIAVSKDKEKVKLETKKKPVTTKTAGPLEIESPEAQSKAAAKRQRDAVRQWAKANGVPCGAKRMGQAVLDAYFDATGIRVDGGWGPKPPADQFATDQLTMEAPEPEPNLDPEAARRRMQPLPGANSSGVTPEMREWAKQNGIPVKGGYVSRPHQAQYIAEMEAMGKLEKLHSDAADVVKGTKLNGVHV